MNDRSWTCKGWTSYNNNTFLCPFGPKRLGQKRLCAETSKGRDGLVPKGLVTICWILHLGRSPGTKDNTGQKICNKIVCFYDFSLIVWFLCHWISENSSVWSFTIDKFQIILYAFTGICRFSFKTCDHIYPTHISFRVMVIRILLLTGERGKRQPNSFQS